jgi:hypothetical protein
MEIPLTAAMVFPPTITLVFLFTIGMVFLFAISSIRRTAHRKSRWIIWNSSLESLPTFLTKDK